MHFPFTSDGCSAVPELDHKECCVRHDWLYWMGGSSRDRRRADRAFFSCLRTTRYRRRAPFRWFGVRVGGAPLLPFPWRWGYGWRYPRWSPPDRDSSAHTAASERAAFDRALANARDHDRRARR